MRTHKRVDLSEEEMKELLCIVKRNIDNGERVSDELLEKLNKPKEIKKSMKKIVSASNATDVRIKKAVKKIGLALDYISRNELKMTYSAIAKYGKVSPITVKKYVTIADGKAITSKDYFYYNLYND